LPGRAAQNEAVTGPCRLQLYAVLGSLLNIKLSGPHRTASASPIDFASSVTSFRLSHFFCFAISFEFGPKRTPFSCFIVCKTASLFAVASLSLLAFHYPTCPASREKVTGDRSSKIIRETAFSATCHFSLRHQSTCHLSHRSLRETASWKVQGLLS